MQLTRVVSMDELYEGRTDQPPDGSFSGRLITVDSGDGTDLYAVVTINDLLPTGCDVVQIDPVSMRVTNVCLAHFSLGVFGLAFGVLGCINVGGGSTYVAYNVGTRCIDLHRYTESFLVNTPATNYTDTNYTNLIPGAIHSDGCDFWFIQTNCNEGGHLIDIWQIAIVSGVVNMTLSQTIDASPFIGTEPVAIVQRTEYDPAHQALIIWIGGGTTLAPRNPL